MRAGADSEPSTPLTPARGIKATVAPPQKPAVESTKTYTAWTFGELPELMEIKRGPQTLIGFPALIDKGAHVEIEVFDEPELAAAKHRAGLRRLVALQIKEPLKYLEKNIPSLTQMAVAYMSLGTAEELREQIQELQKFNQPQRRSRPVVAPYSLPMRRSSDPRCPEISVGNGPLPTRCVLVAIWRAGRLPLHV